VFAGKRLDAFVQNVAILKPDDEDATRFCFGELHQTVLSLFVRGLVGLFKKSS
jgi:hypothetical protein